MSLAPYAAMFALLIAVLIGVLIYIMNLRRKIDEMHGMMGAMLGQMIRPFSINVFMPFFTAILLLAMISISYTVHCGACCCGFKSKRKPSLKVSPTYL